MGYFLNKFHIKPLFEAEVDGENTDSNTEDYTADDSAEADAATEPEQTTEDNPSNEDNKDDNAENENTDENQDDNDQQDDNTSDETTDYTEDFDNQDGEEGSDEGGDDSGSGSDDGEEESEVDELKKKEEELYSNLSPEQLDIKHKELKTQFLEMYDITGSIIDRVTDITVNEDNIEAVEYMSDSLANLRRMLADYMDSVYATKSYTENSVNYNRFLAVLNGINQMLEELLKNKEK